MTTSNEEINYENEILIDRKIVNKFHLHKVMNNGGVIKFNHFGIRIAYNPENPLSPMVEAQLFAVPIGRTYKATVNPNFARMEAAKLKKAKEQEDKLNAQIKAKEIEDEKYAIEEGEAIEL